MGDAPLPPPPPPLQERARVMAAGRLSDAFYAYEKTVLDVAHAYAQGPQDHQRHERIGQALPDQRRAIIAAIVELSGS